MARALWDAAEALTGTALDVEAASISAAR
jgi:hypothetical protein